MRHLIGIEELSVEEIENLISTAEDIIANPKKYNKVAEGKKIATLFYEPSTRTRLSFESAMIELGGNAIGFSDAQSSSVSKGESVADTVKVISCFADIIAMRHFKEGAPKVASLNASIPVINAGDGGHNHPTQTLADLLTIKKEKGRLNNLTVGFCGDLKFGRTVHSLITALSRYTGINIVLISPEELKVPNYIKDEVLEANNISYKEVYDLEEVIGELDILLVYSCVLFVCYPKHLSERKINVFFGNVGIGEHAFSVFIASRRLNYNALANRYSFAIGIEIIGFCGRAEFNSHHLVFNVLRASGG